MTTKQKLLIDRTPQFSIFFQSSDQPAEPEQEQEPESLEPQRRFIAPGATDITFGNVRLEQCLEQCLEQAELRSPLCQHSRRPSQAGIQLALASLQPQQGSGDLV